MYLQTHRAFVRSTSALERVGLNFQQALSLSFPLSLTGRRLSSLVPLLAGLILAFALPLSRAQTPNFNYAEALQKSLYFLDAEKSGPGITGGRVEWRGDSELADTRVQLVAASAIARVTNFSQAFINTNRAVLDPDGDGVVNVSGGYHDAGDHVRFGLPQAYAASTLAWGFFEFPTAFLQSGQRDHLVEELRWFADCFLRCTFRDGSGNVVAFCYQVGDGAVDHTYWGPPELQSETRYARPALFATAEKPASDQVGAHAAALAAIGTALQGIDAPYAARCIDTAQALYAFALAHRGLVARDGFYTSYDDMDDLSWAAIWLFEATGNLQYLADIEAVNASGAYTGFLGKILTRPADDWHNVGVHGWYEVWGGVFLRLAASTGNSRYYSHARWSVEYWLGEHSDVSGYNPLTSSPAGFRVLSQWDSNSYNCAAQLCALVLRKYTGQTVYAEWARDQMNYIMGDNPMKRSYIIGFPTSSASVQHPHHRASHGSLTNNILEPSTHRHVLWGALVAGPGSDDSYDDATSNFVEAAVAIHYNANLVGALAGLYTYYGAGQNPLVGFPPAEPVVQPYFAEVMVGAETTSRTSVTIQVHAEPKVPQFERGLSARYFFDISELIAAGQSIADVSAAFYSSLGEPAPIGLPKLLGPKPWDGGSVYYFELDWTGIETYGMRAFQFFLVAKPDLQGRKNWNAANDWSRQGVTTTLAARSNVTVYRSGALAFGKEPPTTLAANYSVWTSPESRNLRRGTSTTLALSLLRTYGFTGPVTLTVSGLPSGVTASIVSATTSANSAVLTLTASSTAALGIVTVTISGSGTPGARSTTLRLNVGTYGAVGG